MGAKGVGGVPDADRQQMLHFVYQARGEMGFRSGIDLLVEHSPRRLEHDQLYPTGELGRFSAVRLLLGQSFARLKIDLEGSHHSNIVAWEKFLGRVWIDLTKYPMQKFRPAFFLDLSKPLADVRVSGWAVEERIHQSAKIKSGTANQDRNPSAV